MNNIKNSYSVEQLEVLRDKIQNLNNVELHHLKILKIFKDNNCNYSENSNGVFINMNNITDNIIKKINDYLKYIEKQNIKFENYENIKNEYKKEILLL
tara:strand:- start:8221 stop:8514 length:294 start_codon:yes stop_codon:yes gene_type:complete